MPVTNAIAAMAPELAAWRQHLHTMPEVRYDTHRTAAFIADKLRSFGVDEVHEGIGQTGIVAIINGDQPGRTIGLRADMDALPMQEETGLPHASQTPGAMHACGHDGHVTMLLAAARHLADTRNFAGRAALIFQPAEEDGSGGKAMRDAGIFDTFQIAEVYALHNAPGTPVGHFYTTPGPIMAAVDEFTIHINGKGGHGATPHRTIDPISAAVSAVQAIQTIVSRNHYALDDLVISVTQIHAGTVFNVIPDTAMINGTVRTFDKAVQAMVIARLQAIVQGTAATFGVTATLDYGNGDPATVNDPDCTAFAAAVAADISTCDAQAPREMGAEDFSYMLEARPGAYLFVGNGQTAGLHHPKYDFNDETTAYGASFFARLIERALPLHR